MMKKEQNPERTRLNSLKGCIWGGAIGDAFGSGFENQTSNENIEWQTSSWKITDDTQMTLSTLESILESNEVVPKRIAENFVRWFNRGQISGIGSSTLKAIQELRMGGHWALVGRKGEHAAGNGAAMRIAPLAFWLDPIKVEARQVIRDVCRITHHSEEAYCGALAVVFAVKYAREHPAPIGTEFLSFIISNLPDSNTRDRLILFNKAGKDSILEMGNMHGSSGYVAESVPLALFAVSKLGLHSFEEILTSLIECGGDTDTNASIAGQVMGAALGANRLPSFMLEKLRGMQDWNLLKLDAHDIRFRKDDDLRL